MGTVCEPSYGLQDAPTNAKAATIQSHGISKGEFHLMMQQKKNYLKQIKPDYISGVTFSGGDPLHPANHVEVAVLAKEIKETFPNKTIWLYTGFCWDEIKTLDVVKYCDVIVDGPFVQEEFDGKLHWKGSKNQRVIDVQETLRRKEIVLCEF